MKILCKVWLWNFIYSEDSTTSTSSSSFSSFFFFISIRSFSLLSNVHIRHGCFVYILFSTSGLGGSDLCVVVARDYVSVLCLACVCVRPYGCVWVRFVYCDYGQRVYYIVHHVTYTTHRNECTSFVCRTVHTECERELQQCTLCLYGRFCFEVLLLCGTENPSILLGIFPAAKHTKRKINKILRARFHQIRR